VIEAVDTFPDSFHFILVGGGFVGHQIEIRGSAEEDGLYGSDSTGELDELEEAPLLARTGVLGRWSLLGYCGGCPVRLLILPSTAGLARPVV
jgi:hypothetical protein